MSTAKVLGQNKILGEGRYGIVFEDVWRDKPVAIKRIQQLHISSNQREEEALKKLDHPNVIKLLHIDSHADFR
jgi:serine/threonine protein kinase